MRLLVYVILLALILGCHENRRTVTALVSADTLCADKLQVDSESVTMLPDTMYASAKRVRYDVQQLNDSVDGELNTLTNLYNVDSGSFTFRNGPARNADFGGRVTGMPDPIAIDWVFATDFDTCKTKYGTWGGGTGWTGQPLYVRWNKSQTDRIGRLPVATDNFGSEEIIFGSLCGKVYFLNFNTSKPSRLPVDVWNPIKGTVSLAPVYKNNLYVGQGVPKDSIFGHLVVDIDKGEITKAVDRDMNAYRVWGAFDSSPIRVVQFLFWPAEKALFTSIYAITAICRYIL